MKTLKSHLIKTTSGFLSALLPPIHIFILYKFWSKYSRRVDKRYCSCSCWDTVFKGTYESGIASYKHMYFNSTKNTLKIWLITAASLLILYECLKLELKLLVKSQLRFLMAVLFISSIFSHYYTWWVYVNYWNDDFYLQWNHQLFFTVTEIISTSLVLNLSNSKKPISHTKLLLIISLAIIHILSGSLDQFVSNVFLGEGYAHQVLRDLAFLIPDLLHILLPTIELLRNKKKYSQFRGKNFKIHLTYMVGFIIIGSFISINLFFHEHTVIRLKSIKFETVRDHSEIFGSHRYQKARAQQYLKNYIYPYTILNMEVPITSALSPALPTSQESLLYLNYQINAKTARLKNMLEKISEIKKAILELEAKSGEIYLKYNEKQDQLKNELAKNESECQLLRQQIKKILRKRCNMKKDLLKSQFERSANSAVLLQIS